MGTSPSALDRQYNELWQRNLTAVGIKIEFVNQKFADLLKMARAGQLQMWALGNISATPEGYQFLGLLYGGFSGLSNLGRFKQPDFDRVYDLSRSLPDSPERTKYFREMSQIVSAYSPWMLNAFRIENIAVYPWVIGVQVQPVPEPSVAVLRHRPQDAAAAGPAIEADCVRGPTLRTLAPPWHDATPGRPERPPRGRRAWPAAPAARRIGSTPLRSHGRRPMNRNPITHSPAAAARLRMGWVSSMPRGVEISDSRNFLAPQAAPQTLPIAVPIAAPN